MAIMRVVVVVVGLILGVAVLVANAAYIAQHGRLAAGSGELINWLLGL